MDIRSLQRPLKDHVPARPGQFANHADRARHSGRRTDRLFCGLGACNLRGASAQRSWWRRYRSLLGRPAVRRVSRLRPDYLPNGRRCHGNTHRGDRCHSRGRSGSARNARNIERSPSRISEHPSHFRHPRTAGNPRAVKRVAGQNGTILRGDANACSIRRGLRTNGSSSEPPFRI